MTTKDSRDGSSSKDKSLNRRSILLGGTTLAAASVVGAGAPAQQAQAQPAPSGRPPNILVIWGDEFMPGGRKLAKTWHGRFPFENLADDGFTRTSPVGAFPPNGYGLVDMIGNTWEWTTDWWTQKHAAPAEHACCGPGVSDRDRETASYDPRQPQVRIPRKVLKGGSHLCAPSYCRRYRPAARHAEPVDTSTSHVGFRCVVRDGA